MPPFFFVLCIICISKTRTEGQVMYLFFKKEVCIYLVLWIYRWYASSFFFMLYLYEVKVAQWYLTLSDPMDCSLKGSSAHGILQARILYRVASPFSKRSSQPRDQTQVSWIAGRCFTLWATREVQEYWSRYLSLLQGIFPTQESNQGLLHCRCILYQLSYQGTCIKWFYH